MKELLEKAISLLKQLIAVKQQKVYTLYDFALKYKGQYLTLDESVPKDLNCAECMSYILNAYGSPIPKRGLQGTVGLAGWLQKYASEVKTPQRGDIIISITQGEKHGHVGIYDGTYTILSNNSGTGLLDVHLNLPGSLLYYRDGLKLVTKYYRV